MKKLIIPVLIATFLTGCGGPEEVNPAVTSNFDLVSDKDTGIVYIKNTLYGGIVYTPYYDKNGKICRYEDGTLMEVEDD